MKISIEVPSVKEFFRKTTVKRFLKVTSVVGAIASADYFLYGFSHWIIIFAAIILAALNVDDPTTPIGTFLKRIISDGSESNKSIKYLMNTLFAICVLSIVFYAVSPWIYWNDNVSFRDKAYYKLSYFSKYTTIEGVRLQNDCWKKIFSEDYNNSMLIDSDGDGQSQFCETYDDNFLITPQPTIETFFIKSINENRYVLGSPFVWDNLQTNDSSKAIEGYEIIFTSIDRNKNEVSEQLELCAEMFNRKERVFVCYPTNTTIEWLSLHALTELTLTIRSFDFIGRRSIKLQEFPIQLST